MASEATGPRGAARTLLLVGGGHAHVAVLADWIRQGPPAGVRTILVSPHPVLRYSGMVPGWIAGEYERDEGTVDLAALAARADVTLVLGTCTELDPAARIVRTRGGGVLGYDAVSFDTGGEGRAAALLGPDPRIIDVRPIELFVERIAALPTPGHVVVAGGGAGGAELALALRHREPAPAVTMMAGRAGLIPSFAPAMRRKVARAMARSGIDVLAEDARIVGGAVMAGGTKIARADLIVAALGSAAPSWARDSGLAVDGEGFIAVDAHQQSTSHASVFAAGDVASRVDRPLARSGVHAVFAGPVLAANLRVAMAGRVPRARYHPRWNNLYIVNTGDGSAIASYGPFAAEGRWVRAAKHWIDKRWIAQYAALGNG